MRLSPAILLLVLTISGAQGQTAPSPSSVWPPLPNTGFISGRAATDQDVADGNAAFVLKVYGAAVGKPLDGVTIPQYAYLMNKGDKPVPVIVIQAETYRGLKLIGIRDLVGKTSSVKQADLQLLGTTPPK